MAKLKNMLKKESVTIGNDENVGKRNDCTDIMISAKFGEDHIHHILPPQPVVDKFVDDLMAYTSEDFNRSLVGNKFENSKPPKEVIFHNRQAFGDILTMTCLYYHSPVLLDNGKTELIGKIVKDKKEVIVKSFNENKNIFENKKITNWIKHDIGNHIWHHITYENAPISQVTKKGQGVYLTEDHKILTRRGMVRVDEIEKNDVILTREKCLNEKQKQFFIGTMLGDSWLVNTKTEGRGYFSYKHTEDQLELVCLKNKALNGFNFSIYTGNGKGSRKDTIHSQYRTNVEFGQLYNKWYEDGKKSIPIDLCEDDFTPLTLAVWYMDDGNLNGDTGALLCSESFTREENEFLADILKKKFDFNVKIRKNNRLYIGNGHKHGNDKSSDRFFEMISSYIPNSFKYKLPEKYRDVDFDIDLWDIGSADLYYAKPIIKKENPSSEEYSRYVYCLEVEDNHNFISNNMIFSNCAVRDFKNQFPKTRVGVHTTAMHIWDNNPHIDHTFRMGSLSANKAVVKIGPGFLTNKSGMWDYHMANAFRMDIQNKTGLKITQGPVRPDIWFTEEEFNRKPVIDIDKPYWVFIYGGEPGWPSKQYHRWQEVIDILKDDIQFVQLGVKGHPYPRLNNVIDYVGKTEDRNTGIRDLFNIFLHAEGSMGLVSMHMHLSAVFNHPCVVLAAGREPASFTQYYGHQYVQNNGALPCVETKACWACKLEGCKNIVNPSNTPTNGHNTKQIPKCVDIIEPEQIVEGVRQYYKGGRLTYGKKTPNTFFKNIVREKKVFSIPQPEKVDNDLLKKYGFEWGGGSITDKDWLFLCDIFDTYGVKKVLEFGAGLSSLLMASKVDDVVTFETQQGWIDEIKGMSDERKNHLFLWDGRNLDLKENDFKDLKFDFAFVDGPAGGSNREFSTMYASKMADIIVIHDAGREWERKWQDKYLAKDFEMTSKGGHRCHLWIKKEIAKKQNEERKKIINLKIADDYRKSFRMVTTCRGFGGSERSSLFIMNDMLSRGYRVELISTGNISGEYKKNIPSDVIVRSWEDMTEPIDLLTFYASDCIFNFNKPQYLNMMDKLNCKKKVMILNYKLGWAGKSEWTKKFDSYMFLNSTNEKALLERIPNAKTKVLPPPTDLTEFFKVNIDYGNGIRLGRHSSQRDAKWPDYSNEMIQQIWDEINDDIKFYFMPSRSNCIDDHRIYKFKVNEIKVNEFLSKINLFFYHLPPGYTDAGPRVILEAAACGLPIIADNHSGPKDRIIPEIGWLCDDVSDYLDIISDINKDLTIIEKKGKMARKYAKDNFIGEKWCDYIING